MILSRLSTMSTVEGGGRLHLYLPPSSTVKRPGMPDNLNNCNCRQALHWWNLIHPPFVSSGCVVPIVKLLLHRVTNETWSWQVPDCQFTLDSFPDPTLSPAQTRQSIQWMEEELQRLPPALINSSGQCPATRWWKAHDSNILSPHNTGLWQTDRQTVPPTLKSCSNTAQHYKNYNMHKAFAQRRICSPLRATKKIKSIQCHIWNLCYKAQWTQEVVSINFIWLCFCAVLWRSWCKFVVYKVLQHNTTNHLSAIITSVQMCNCCKKLALKHILFASSFVNNILAYKCELVSAFQTSRPLQ